VPATGPSILKRAVIDGDRRLDRDAHRWGEEFRELRLRAAATQAAVGRAIGVTRSVICRLESGDTTVSPHIRARAAIVVGGDSRTAIYGGASPLLYDAAHARIIERVLALRHRRWRPTLEAPVPGPGRRSTDIRLADMRDIVLMEVESHIRRLEAGLREWQDKRSSVSAALEPDGVTTARVHAVLVLPPTRHHRALVRELRSAIDAAFPVPSDMLLEALRSERGPWPGDGILWVAGGRDRSADR